MKTKSHKKHLRVTKRKSNIPAIVIIAILAAVGVYTLTLSKAASPYVTAEASSGSLSNGATLVTDSSASDGQAVDFSTGSTSNSCTDPSSTIPYDTSNAQSGVTEGNYYVTNDTWNASGYPVSQTLYVCNYNNWYVTAKMNNDTGDGAVKTYPNVQEDFNNVAISSFKTLTANYGVTDPEIKNGIYEFAYDMWIDGYPSPDNNYMEVMIWTDNHGQTPAGSPQKATLSDGGQTYTVYYSSSDRYIAFVPATNTTTGSTNIEDFLNYIVTKGWFNSSTPYVTQICYGAELVSTNSAPGTFIFNNFSISDTQ